MALHLSPSLLANDGDEHWDDRFGPPGVNGEVKVLTTVGDDIYVGGEFTRVGSISALHIARWNTLEHKWYPLGAGTDGTVLAIVADGDKIYVGGQFTHAGPTDAFNLAIYQISSGTWSSWGDGVSGDLYAYVSSIALSGGYVYIGGRFEAIGTILANNIARWNGTKFERLGAGCNDPVYAVLAVGTDIYVGGEFSSAGNAHSRHIARFDGANWFPVDTGTSGNVNALAYNKGQLYVGGRFDYAGAVFALNIVRWDIAASAFVAMGTGVKTPTAVQTNGPAFVNSIAVADTEVYLGGIFLQAGRDFYITSHIARWNGVDWEALHYQVPGRILVSGCGVASNPNHLAKYHSDVNAIAVHNGTPFFGGLFDHAFMRIDVIFNSNSPDEGLYLGLNANNIVAWDRNSHVFRSLGDSPNDTIQDVAASGSELIIGGHFTSSDGLASNNSVLWNSSSHSWRGADTGIGNIGSYVVAVAGNKSYYFAATDSLVYRLDRSGGRWESLGSPGIGAGLRALAANDFALFVAGDSGIAEWSAGRWRALDGTAGRSVKCITVDSNELYAGGKFSTIGGVPAENIARFDVASRAWTALGTGTDGAVNAMASNGNDLYAAGLFLTAGGTTARRVAHWNKSDGSWTGLEEGLDGPVACLAFWDGRLFAAGNFQSAGTGISASNVAMWNGEGWYGLGSGLNGPARSIAGSLDGLFVVGDFVQAGGKPSFRVAKWNDAQSSVAVKAPAPASGRSQILFLSSYPNPFSRICNIRYNVTSKSSIPLSFYIVDAEGKVCETLSSELTYPGLHDISWDASSSASGVYYLYARTAEGVFSTPIILARQ